MADPVADRGRGEAALWWAAVQSVAGIGPARALHLARTFGSAQKALQATVEELAGRGRLSLEQAQALAAMSGSLARVSERLDLWRRAGIEALALEDERYPAGLRDLRSPPPLLFLRGELRPDDGRAVTIVGTREPSREGARLARGLARGLAARGFTIVSGLARGIDSAGHRGALAARGGRTIAVLGSGLLRIYPPENSVLAATIARRGCLMAEVSPDVEVDRRHLLARDRIQAALPRAVIVVQAYEQCGSIVTARHARQCGRMLLAVPWREPPFSHGWERLREMGARPIAAEAELDDLVAALEAEPPVGAQKPLL